MTPQQMFQQPVTSQQPQHNTVTPHPAGVTPESRFQTGQPAKPAGIAGPPKSLAVPEYRINPQGINQGVVNRDGASIPNDPANRDWQQYLAWDKTHNAAPMAGTTGGTTGPVKDWSFLNDPRYAGLKNSPEFQQYLKTAAGKGPTSLGTGFNLFDAQNSLSKFAQGQDPAKAKAHLDELIANKQQDELFNKAFRQDQNGHFIPNNSKIKYGTPGPGGAKFGQNTFFSQDYSKQVSKVPGSGVYSLGIDPSDPNANAYAAAFIRAKENSPTGPGTAWSKILGNGKWGRFDAKVPGLKALKAQFPKATDLQLLDAVVRMAHSQAALEPVDDTMKILGPLMVAAGVFLGPLAATALGSTMGAGTAATLGGGFMGTLSSGIQSDWDPGAMALGGAGGMMAGGFNPFNPAAAFASNATAPSLTNLAVNTAIQESANIDPNLALALSLGKAGVTSFQTGNFSPLLKKGAGYLFGQTVPGLPGKLGEYAISNYRSAPQQNKDKVRS